MVREWKTASRTLNDFNCEREEDSWLPVARRNCRRGMFVHGGGQHWWEKLLWQITVAIKCDPVLKYAPNFYRELQAMELHRLQWRRK